MDGLPERRPAPPVHVAIIMDGNGRWAKARSLPRIAGHRRGADAVRRTVRAAAELGVSYLTLFGFSSENWRRPIAEVEDLMGLLRIYLRSEIAELHQNGIKLRVIGQRERLSEDIRRLIENAERLTADNTSLNLTIALSYGGRSEIVVAARAAAQAVADGKLAIDAMDEDSFAGFLLTRDLPDPDLLIRTSGEKRVSNFLLWQTAYAELVFLDTMWPDFSKEDFEIALQEYHGRERRFGASVSTR